MAHIEAEAASRTPEQLQAFIDGATRDHGKEGPKSVARASEAARLAWVENRLVELGRTRARSVGWTDVYTFAKALAERVVADLGRGPDGKRRRRFVRELADAERMRRPGCPLDGTEQSRREQARVGVTVATVTTI